MSKFKGRRFLALLAAILPTAAVAGQPGWYLAIDGGQTHYTGVRGNAQQWILATPAPENGMMIMSSRSSLQQNESKDSGYKLTIGYQFNPYIGVEGGYSVLGNVRANGSGSMILSPTDEFLPLEQFATFTDGAKLQARGWELAATGSWPLNPQWSLLGRVGVFDAHSKLDITSTPAPPSPGGQAISVSESSSKWTPTYGVGVSFAPVAHWAVRLDWDRYAHLGDRDTSIGSFSVNLLSVGVVYTL